MGTMWDRMAYPADPVEVRGKIQESWRGMTDQRLEEIRRKLQHNDPDGKDYKADVPELLAEIVHLRQSLKTPFDE